jgi:hypothetical protein
MAFSLVAAWRSAGAGVIQRHAGAFNPYNLLIPGRIFADYLLLTKNSIDALPKLRLKLWKC